MPRDHLLTGGFANSEKIVMTIHTGELPPIPTEMLPAPAPRYYWRGVVYAQYMGTGWVSSTVTKQSISADTPLLPALLNEYHLIKMDVQMVEPEGRLFWSGTLFSVDVPFTAQWRLRPTSDLFADQTALVQADLFAAVSEVIAYHAETYIPSPTLNDLRSASSEYPEEIFNRYLVLPRDVPDRVITLAFKITEGIENPYDKAKAIETYLRKNYPYDLEVPAPPPDQDVADYFLFDLKKGYCDYYATAMVVMARAIGLPARFVSGYSPGSYDAPNARYVIRELNAHSWAEVYFPEIGWVEFEPTASVPVIDREAEEPSPLQDPENQESAAQLLTRFRLERVLLWLSPVFIALAVMLLYFTVLQRWLLLRLEPSLAIHRIYQNFYRAGRPLTGTWIRSGTSSEYLDKIIEVAEELKSVSRSLQTLNSLKENTSALTRIYQNSLFVEYHSTRQDARHAWQIWSRLRFQLWVMRMVVNWAKLKRIGTGFFMRAFYK
jgi:transglutaminase-like putative cysteine protease